MFKFKHLIFLGLCFGLLWQFKPQELASYVRDFTGSASIVSSFSGGTPRETDTDFWITKADHAWLCRQNSKGPIGASRTVPSGVTVRYKVTTEPSNIRLPNGSFAPIYTATPVKKIRVL